MKIWLTFLSLALGTALWMTAGAADAPAAPAADKRPMAVLFYADWCSNCKELEPKYEKARAGLEDKIQFVKLDVTDAERKSKTREQAKSLGIYPLYVANTGTGWVALLDASGNKVGEIKSDESSDDMRAALMKLVPAGG